MAQPTYGPVSHNSTTAVGNISQKTCPCAIKVVILGPFLHKKKMYVVIRFSADLKSKSEDLDIVPYTLGKGKLLKLYLAQGEDEGGLSKKERNGISGGNTSMALWTSKKKELCSCFVFYARDQFAAGYPAASTLHLIVPREQLHTFFADSCHHCWMLTLNCVLVLTKPPPLLPLSTKFLHADLCQAGSAEDHHLHEMPDESNINECMWSSLPVLFLWMIKDKLDFFDDVPVASVCRHWWYASTCYPKRQSIGGDGIPWLGQRIKNAKSTAWEFICIKRKRKFTVDLPEFTKAVVLFSKQGWLLLHRFNGFESMNTQSVSVLLINPLTMDKINMPNVVYSSPQNFGSFSIHDGKPHCVVLLELNVFQLAVRIAYPGDEVWTTHTFGLSRPIRGCSGLLIMGEHIYCSDPKGNMIVYNMVSQVLKEVPHSGPSSQLETFIMEYEGQIIQYGRSDYRLDSYCLFSYNHNNNVWEKLNGEDVKDTSFFLSFGGSFSAREKCLKAYFLQHKGAMASNYYRYVSIVELTDRSTEDLDLAYSLGSLAVWIDLG